MRDATERAPWERVLEEIRSLRQEAAARDDEVWEAIEEIRGLLAEAGIRPAGDAGEAARDAHRLDPAAYRALKRRLRMFVARALPEGGRVAVVSRGDDELLELPRCEGEHYPRDATGGYLGYYPVDGTAAVAHLEWVRAQGVEYLLFPDTAAWWLEKFPRFAAHLRRRFPRVAAREGVGILYRVAPGAGAADGGHPSLESVLDAWEEHLGAAPSVMDWTGGEVEARLPGRTVFAPIRPEPPLPYLDDSVDVVVVGEGPPEALDEARRIARRTVVHAPRTADSVSSGAPAPTVEHLGEAPGALPPVSVVVPTHDGIAHLEPCLRALDETLPDGEGVEVLVVDDASGPGTAGALGRLEDAYRWLRVLRNDANQGFIESCNRGAREARGRFLVFLNDDTVPLPGWLSALLRTFRSHPDAGAVGGRLLYPDGRLQEAGGVLFHDARGANLGRGDDEADAPLYAHVRRVHYCSGALLATPRDLFLELGGFDLRFRPAYYEDADYCFSVRQAGLGVYYQPEAVVVHVEGASSGTDLESGVKRHQVRNRRSFRRKWRDRLAGLEPAPGAYPSGTWHRLAFAGGDR